MKMKLWILAILMAALLAGCAPSREPTLPRAQPAFLQWLIRQSMRMQAQEKIAEVSQTSRLWMNSGGGHSPAILLAAAPSWLEVNALANTPKRPLFKILAPEMEEIAAFGFGGIFLGPTGERSGIWLGESKEKIQMGGEKGKSFGHDCASLSFDASLGSEDDFEHLSARAEKNHIQLGADLMDPAPGIGPDFLLAARHVSGYSGLYAMMPVPGNLWVDLPKANSEWDLEALNAAQTEKLVSAGILPPAIARDKLDWIVPGGWAVTGPVMGVDGQQRRWVYRYSDTPQRAMFLWQDPSSEAKKIFSASIIINTGFNRQSLVGIRIEPFIGFETASDDAEFRKIMAPAMQALDEIAAEVHRYGGWAIQSSPLPLPALVQIVSSGNCDFCGDAITPALVVAAIRAKDAAPLASLYKSWLESGLPLSKLGRGLNDGEGIYWKFLRGLPDGDKIINDAGFFNDAPNQRNGIMDITRAFAASKAGDAPNAKTVCELLLAWRLGLPGLAFISASELEVMGKNFAGAAYTLNSGGKEGALFADRISAILKDRQKNDLANGRLVQVSSPKGGAMAVLSELPNGDFWFMGTNFGSTREVVELEAPKYKTARDILTGKDLGPANAGKFSLALDGGQARHVLLHMK